MCQSTSVSLTVELPESPAIFKFFRCNSGPIIFNSTISPGVIDGNVDLGSTGIQRVGDEAADYSVQGRDVDR